MILELASNDVNRVHMLFDSFNKVRAIILPAIEQRRCRIWVDSMESPSVALWQLKILNAIAGDSTQPVAEELINKLEPMQVLFVPDNGWERLLRDIWGDKLGVQPRTQLSPHLLDIGYLAKLRESIPTGFTLERMDLATVKSLDKRIATHIPLFFGGSKKFFENGIGFCIKHEGRVVSSASTFTPFVDEFEIQVDTVNESFYQRRGLATAVSAALIIYALEHHLTPHWDAANEKSLALALRLGYKNPQPWEAYYLKP